MNPCHRCYGNQAPTTILTIHKYIKRSWICRFEKELLFGNYPFKRCFWKLTDENSIEDNCDNSLRKFNFFFYALSHNEANKTNEKLHNLKMRVVKSNLSFRDVFFHSLEMEISSKFSGGFAKLNRTNGKPFFCLTLHDLRTFSQLDCFYVNFFVL